MPRKKDDEPDTRRDRRAERAPDADRVSGTRTLPASGIRSAAMSVSPSVGCTLFACNAVNPLALTHSDYVSRITHYASRAASATFPPPSGKLPPPPQDSQ